MAKPIFIAKLKGFPEETVRKEIVKHLTKELGSNYLVLAVFDECFEDKYSFECFNDCKGLKDIDIEKLIKEFHETKST